MPLRAATQDSSAARICQIMQSTGELLRIKHAALVKLTPSPEQHPHKSQQTHSMEPLAQLIKQLGALLSAPPLPSSSLPDGLSQSTTIAHSQHLNDHSQQQQQKQEHHHFQQQHPQHLHKPTSSTVSPQHLHSISQALQGLAIASKFRSDASHTSPTAHLRPALVSWLEVRACVCVCACLHVS